MMSSEEYTRNRIASRVLRAGRMLRTLIAGVIALPLGLVIFAPIFAIVLPIALIVTTFAAITAALGINVFAERLLTAINDFRKSPTGFSTHLNGVTNRVGFVIASPILALTIATVAGAIPAAYVAGRVYSGVSSALNFITKPFAKLLGRGNALNNNYDDDDLGFFSRPLDYDTPSKKEEEDIKPLHGTVNSKRRNYTPAKTTAATQAEVDTVTNAKPYVLRGTKNKQD